MKVRLKELAEIAVGRLFGDQDKQITGIAEIDKAGPGDVTYAVNARYLRKLTGREVGAVIVPTGTSDIQVFDGTTLIEVENPYWSFARVLALFAPEIPEAPGTVHPSAIVDDDADVAPDVTIGPFTVIEGKVLIEGGSVIGPGCHIAYGARVGRDCKLYHNVTIREFCVLGDRVVINAGSVIGTDGYGYVEKDGRYHKIPQIGIVRIEDDVEIGSLVCIDRATIGETVIGTGTKMDNLIQIGHNVELGANCAVVSQVGISGSTKVGKNCRFAGQSATSGHLTIGEGSTIAARGVAVRDLPPGSFVSGFPARPHEEERKILAALPRLPDLLRRISRLERIVEEYSNRGKSDNDEGGV